MKKTIIAYMLLLCMLVTACSTPANKENHINIEDTHFTYEFADAETGTQLLLGNTEYHENLTKTDLEYKLQKKDATKEEYLAFAEAQVLEFTEEEKEIVSECMERIEHVIRQEGYVLPEINTVNFVKTTMKEEGGASAYTHKSDIYLGADMLAEILSAPEENKLSLTILLLHELFHCLTRNHPEFRSKMYDIIDFTVTEEDFAIAPQIRDRMISNPDVGNHDAYASFVINGEQTDCFVIYMTTKAFENAGETFFDHTTTHLVPVDDPNTVYTMEDAENFWEVFGENTSYVIDPEECLADNFSYAFLSGEELHDVSWKTPEIIEAISALLRAEN